LNFILPHHCGAAIEWFPFSPGGLPGDNNECPEKSPRSRQRRGLFQFA
jgi:hypothetical protein